MQDVDELQEAEDELGLLLPTLHEVNPPEAVQVAEEEREPALSTIYTCHICGSKWDNPRKRNGHMSSCKRRAKSSSTTMDPPQSQPCSSTTLDAPQSQPAPDSEFPCEICGKTFTTPKGRSSHKGRVHKKTSLSLPI